MSIDAAVGRLYTTSLISMLCTEPLIRVHADPCPAFSALGNTRAMGLLAAQLRVHAVAYWATEMTLSMADLTRCGQRRVSEMVAGFSIIILPPAIAEGYRNDLILQVLGRIA